MKTEFDEMLDGMLGSLRKFNNFIYLYPPDARVISTPYLSASRALKTEKEEIGNNASMKAAAPTQSEWYSPIFLEPNNN